MHKKIHVAINIFGIINNYDEKNSKTQITKYSFCTTHENLQNKFGKKTKLRKKYAVAFIGCSSLKTVLFPFHSHLMDHRDLKNVHS